MNQIGLDPIATSVLAVFLVVLMEPVNLVDVFVTMGGQGPCVTPNFVITNVRNMANVSMEAVSVNRDGMGVTAVLTGVPTIAMDMESVNYNRVRLMISRSGDVNVRMVGEEPSVIRDRRPTVRTS